MARGYTKQVSQESIQEDGKITQKRTIPFPSLNHNTQEEEEEKKHKSGKKAALLSWAHYTTMVHSVSLSSLQSSCLLYKILPYFAWSSAQPTSC